LICLIVGKDTFGRTCIWQVFERPNFVSPVNGPLEEKVSRFVPIQLTMLSNKSRSPDEIGERANSLRWGRNLLVVGDEIQSLECFRIISMWKSVLNYYSHNSLT